MSHNNHSRPTKILYCEANIDETIGGSYYSLLYLTKGLDKALYTPVVVFHKTNPLLPIYKKNNIDTFVIEKRKAISLPIISGNRSTTLHYATIIIQKLINITFSFPLTLIKHVCFIKRHGIEIIHLNNSIKGNQSWMVAALATNTPCITHQRGIFFKFSLKDRLLSRKMKAIICVSDAVRDNLIAHSFKPDNLVTIHNGIDPCSLQVHIPPETMKRRYGIPSNAKVIGLLGNIREWKGQETALRALPCILEVNPNTILMLIGDASKSDSEYCSLLQRVIRDLRIKGNVIFTGYASNVADFINIMDIVIHTSIEPEPFGRVIIEGMCLSKPVIGSRIGGVTEIIDDGITGFTFTPGSHNELSTVVNHLLSNNKKRMRVGKNARDHAQRHFHIRNNIEKTQALYKSILCPT